MHADNSNIDEVKYPGATILLGNVYVEHEGITLRSKKAIYYKSRNFLKAFGNVYLNQGDTITQTSNYVDYNGDTKKESTVSLYGAPDGREGCWSTRAPMRK